MAEARSCVAHHEKSHSKAQTRAIPKPFADGVLCMQGNCNGDANQRSVTVMITDGCPECEADHMDMQALTYEKVSNACWWYGTFTFNSVPYI